jgi:hypothetical protein
MLSHALIRTGVRGTYRNLGRTQGGRYAVFGFVLVCASPDSSLIHQNVDRCSQGRQRRMKHLSM